MLKLLSAYCYLFLQGCGLLRMEGLGGSEASSPLLAKQAWARAKPPRLKATPPPTKRYGLYIKSRISLKGAKRGEPSDP